MNNTLILLAGKYLILFYLLPPLYFFLRGKRRVALRAVFSTLLAIGISLFINFLYPVQRPFEVWETEPAVPVFFFEHVADVRTASFPSKHTAAAAAMAFSFSGSDATFGALLFVGALLVGTARVFALIHRWVDVLGGVSVGLVSWYLVKQFVKIYKRKPG